MSLGRWHGVGSGVAFGPKKHRGVGDDGMVKAVLV